MDLNETKFQASHRHPWETSRFGFFARLLQMNEKPVRILDAGAGDGWFSCSLHSVLPEGSTITCYDMHYTPEHLSELQKSAPPGVTFTTLPPEGIFDIVLLLDVAEHVEDDQKFLSNLVNTNIASHGHLLFSVPAWPHLYSGHDRFLRHFRRYTPAQAKELLSASGLETTRSGGLFHLLFIARSLQISFKKTGSQSSDISWHHGPLVTGAVYGVLYVDTLISRLMSFAGISLPGLSWWASCRKRT